MPIPIESTTCNRLERKFSYPTPLLPRSNGTLSNYNKVNPKRKEQRHGDGSEGLYSNIRPSFFPTPQMQMKAQIVREERDRVTSVKTLRKATILHSLGNMGLDDDCSLFAGSVSTASTSASSTDSPMATPVSSPLPSRNRRSVKPQKTYQDRVPFKFDGAHTESVDGEVVPSDQAYADMILDNGESLPQGTAWSDFVMLESLSDKFCDDISHMRYVNTHIITYNGEPIWRLKTEHMCNSSGTRGQSSSCILMKAQGCLRVKITHKGRNNLGGGWNSRETREYNIEDMIRESGEARGRELFSQ